MKNNHISKILSIAIIMLFIGISIQPALPSYSQPLNEKNQIKDGYTEVTVEVYGIKDFKNATFYLTNNESERLNSIITSYKNKMETANSLKESEYILNNTLDNLTNLGLINGKEIKDSIKTAKEIYENIGYKTDEQSTFEANVTINYLVFIALRANAAYFMPSYIAILYHYMMNYEYYQEHYPIFSKICESIFSIINSIAEYIENYLDTLVAFQILLLFFVCYYFINPFPIGYAVSFLGTDITDTGWVYAVGLKGIQSIKGKYRGALAGFTGLRIFIDSDYYMVGLALASALEEVD